MTDTAYRPHPRLLRPANRPTDRWADVLMFITGGYLIDDAHLLRGPRAVVELVEPEASSQPIITPHSTILHTNAAPAWTWYLNLIRYWRRSDVTGEAHFQVAGVADDGTLPASDRRAARIVQAIPMNRRADCNYKGNAWWYGAVRRGAISFETEDNGAATLDRTPWSVAQFELLVAAHTCISVVYGVWCTPPTRWDDGGIGHHALHPEWSIYRGKTCPGAARIRQMDELRRRVAANLAAFSTHTGWRCGQ